MEMLSEEDQIARALAMSMEGAGGSSSSAAAPPAATSAAAQVTSLASVLGSLPGVDPNDPRIQNAMRGNNNKKDGEKKKDAEKK